MKLPQLIISLALIILSAAVAAQTPTERHGRLQVIGTKLCDERGNPVQLRGMSTHGLQWYGYPDKLTTASLDVLAKDWQADILRLSMYCDEGGYKRDPERFKKMVDALVDETLARGMYVILDWHQLSPGDPWANIDHAKEYFSHMSAKHGGKKFILYEICNEPNGKSVDWPRVKSYAEEIIPVIRANDPGAVVIVGTPDWSSLGSSGGRPDNEILDNPLTGDVAKNIVYCFHFYAASHKEGFRRRVERHAEKLPLFCSEWGSQEASGDGPNDFESTAAWHALMDRHQISWTNWNYSDDHRSGAVWQRGTLPAGPFADERLKEAGKLVKGLIQAPRAPAKN